MASYIMGEDQFEEGEVWSEGEIKSDGCCCCKKQVEIEIGVYPGSREDSQVVSQEVSQEIPQEIPREIPQEIPREIPQEIPQRIQLIPVECENGSAPRPIILERVENTTVSSQPINEQLRVVEAVADDGSGRVVYIALP